MAQESLNWSRGEVVGEARVVMVRLRLKESGSGSGRWKRVLMRIFAVSFLYRFI